MRPVGRGHSGDEIRNTGSVLRNANAMAAGGPGVAIRHVNRALFVRDGDELDAGGGKDIERIHEGGADDAEHVFDAVDGEDFDQGLRGSHFLRRLTHMRLLMNISFMMTFCTADRKGYRPR